MIFFFSIYLDQCCPTNETIIYVCQKTTQPKIHLHSMGILLKPGVLAFKHFYMSLCAYILYMFKCSYIRTWRYLNIPGSFKNEASVWGYVFVMSCPQAPEVYLPVCTVCMSPVDGSCEHWYVLEHYEGGVHPCSSWWGKPRKSHTEDVTTCKSVGIAYVIHWEHTKQPSENVFFSLLALNDILTVLYFHQFLLSIQCWFLLLSLVS